MKTIVHMVMLLTLAGTAAAQILPPGKVLIVTPDMRAQIDSMAQRTAKTRIEQVQCITGRALRDTVNILAEMRPAKNIERSDSLNVMFNGPPCEDDQPMIHSHIVQNQWWQWATPVDYRTAAVRGVYGLLVSVTPEGKWTLKAYP